MLQSLFPTEIVLKEDSAQSSGAPPLDPEQNILDDQDIKALENKTVQKDRLDDLIESQVTH
ncbi:MAG: hypothetical protein K2X66_16520, partial [Cyanobacteria bacterium]|nr:hypothetical protein [Cyanobacteriota bacterium]